MNYKESTLKQGHFSFFENLLRHPMVSLFIICLLVTPLKLSKINELFTQNTTVYLAIIGFSLILFFAVFLYIKGSLNTRNIIILMIIAGFFLRLLYILYTDLSERQHDIGSFFTNDDGHATYIKYLMENKHLPDFDVRERWQFYHPPLFHIICAVWLSLLQLLFSAKETFGCTQIVTLFFSSAVIIISYKIFKELNLKKQGLIISTSLVCFSPTFIYFAGTVNNDIMAVSFMLLSILFAIRWYKNSSFKNIILLALCIGFGMMTKLSVWMTSPPVCVLFLAVFFKNIKKWKTFISQFFVFGVICIPLGIWWEIRNFFMFNVPMAFIPSAGNSTDPQYIGNGVHSITERLFDFNFSQLKSVYDHFTMFGDSYNEYNPTIGLFKTALFGERINDTAFPIIKFAGPILFYSAIILSFLAIILIIKSFFDKKPKQNSAAVLEYDCFDIFIKISLSLFVLINLISYYTFCIKFPLTCTQHARYCMSAIPILAFYLGKSFDKSKKAICVTITVFTIIYCLSSAFIYSVIN